MSDDRSEVKTNDDGKLGRSAIASRRLQESMKSGDLVIDERKRKRFEEKCIQMDRGAKFRYRDASWQVVTFGFRRNPDVAENGRSEGWKRVRPIAITGGRGGVTQGVNWEFIKSF